jgi:glycosyltransferase involved in cell wall biosynthesis
MSHIQGIKCIAPILDRSGYAEWSRNYITALAETGVPITVRPVSFDRQLSSDDASVQPLLKYVNRPVEYNVVIAWLTPNAAKPLLDNEKESALKVLFTLWETTQLPSEWPDLINSSATECWVSGPWSEDVFIKSGVDIPIKQFRYPINFSNYDIDASVVNKPFNDDTYLFYTISQWSERKNFRDLLEAYWSEFNSNDNVALLLKTHVSSNSPAEYAQLLQTIKAIKDRGVFGSTAPVMLLTEMFSNDQILGLHKICDCYVSTSRGEGLGLGMLEAGLFGNLVITSSFGEQSSYITEDRGYVVSHNLRPVTGMGNSLYTGSQYWAQPSVYETAKAMRKAYVSGISDGVKVQHPEAKKLNAYLKETCLYGKVAHNLLHSLENSLEYKSHASSKVSKGS